MVIEIELYGTLKKLGNFSLEFVEPVLIREIKQKVKERLLNLDSTKSELVNSSAFSDQKRILKDDDLISDSCQIALLPPVCGG